jgi:hypothetical protein
MTVSENNGYIILTNECPYCSKYVERSIKLPIRFADLKIQTKQFIKEISEIK